MNGLEQLNVHICQARTYQKFIEWCGTCQGQRVLDFGPGSSPFGNYLMGRGAEVFWLDRNEHYRDIHRGTPWNPTSMSPVDVVIASNSIQHNMNYSDVFAQAVDTLREKGLFFLSEKLEPKGPTWWWFDRNDPCWVRSLEDHFDNWVTAGLRLIRLAFLQYTWDQDSTKETSAWVTSEQANQVIALLERIQ